jgi:hypothetical protein
VEKKLEDGKAGIAAFVGAAICQTTLVFPDIALFWRLNPF